MLTVYDGDGDEGVDEDFVSAGFVSATDCALWVVLDDWAILCPIDWIDIFLSKNYAVLADGLSASEVSSLELYFFAIESQISVP